MQGKTSNHRRKVSTKYRTEYIPLDCDALLRELQSGCIRREVPLPGDFPSEQSERPY